MMKNGIEVFNPKMTVGREEKKKDRTTARSSKSQNKDGEEKQKSNSSCTEENCTPVESLSFTKLLF